MQLPEIRGRSKMMLSQRLQRSVRSSMLDPEAQRNALFITVLTRCSHSHRRLPVRQYHTMIFSRPLSCNATEVPAIPGAGAACRLQHWRSGEPSAGGRHWSGRPAGWQGSVMERSLHDHARTLHTFIKSSGASSHASVCCRCSATPPPTSVASMGDS